MSANDILDVLNIQRDEAKLPSKKKQKTTSEPRQTGLARELYNLLGPNTPPISLGSTNQNTIKANPKMKPSPWTRMPFLANNKQKQENLQFHHWVKGSKELLESEEPKPYFFEKFNVKLDIPELPDEETYYKYLEEIKQHFAKLRAEKRKRDLERKEQERLAKEKKESEIIEKEKTAEKEKESEKDLTKVKEDNDEIEVKNESNLTKQSNVKDGEEKNQEDSSNLHKISKDDAKNADKKVETIEENENENDENEEEIPDDFSYEETKYLFDLCDSFELKWPIVYDRYFFRPDRSLEDLKEHFYQVCIKILENKENSNPALIESLKAFSKTRELERKAYLETLLKRTSAEIAEEESLVIEARRFELAAKKMLLERSNLLTLLDSPQTTQSIAAYQSSQGLANLYNHLMIADKNQKKRQSQQQQRSLGSNLQDPVPPPIPTAASSSIKKDRSFQTHLQQYLSGLLKQNQNSNSSQKPDSSAIQQLLMKRLTQKEEEAYGLYYHANEKLNPGVTLRSAQRLPGLQQKQSVLKLVNSMLQELDIPTAGGTSWKPIMPTRKTMAKYDELIRAVVALLDVKRGKDKLEAEIRLIKSQRGIQ